MLNIFQKQGVFFDLFDQMGTHIVSCARHLNKLASEFPMSGSEVRRIHDDEHSADELSRIIVERLHGSFVPVIDREDIHALTGGLDDIIDMMDDVGQRFELYQVDRVDPTFVRQTEVLVRAAATVNEAVRRLRTSRLLSDLGPTLIEIHRLESVGDDNHHAALARLFDGTFEPLFVLKWKELHVLIENAIDACEDVGNILERIVLKGA
jgi:uncharacterized protein Yka (UPF0111/DUF47 family)